MAEKTKKSAEVGSEICTVYIGGQQYEVERKKLSDESPVLERMLNADFKTHSQYIELKDVKPFVFENILKYISGTRDDFQQLSTDLLINIVYFANKYMMKKCEEFIWEIIASRIETSSFGIGLIRVPVNDILTVCATASTLKNEKIFNQCLKELKGNQFHTLPLHSEIYEMREDDFGKLVKALSVEELLRYEMIIMYIMKNHDTSEQKINVTNMLMLIDYRQMSLTEFLNGPGVSTFLTDGQKYYLLRDVVNEHVKKCPPKQQ